MTMSTTDQVTDVDLGMMDRALLLAQSAAEHGEVPVGAVIYHGDRVIAEAANNREASGDPTGHAEVVAMRRAGEALASWRLGECSMAVTLEPCPMCAGAAVNARLGRLIYGAKDAKAGACDSLYEIPTDARLNHRVIVHGGVRAAESAALLAAFFTLRRSSQGSS